LLDAFSLEQRSAREKALQKENAGKRISRSAERDQRCARWIGGRFLKKATQKLLNRLRRQLKV